MRKLRIILLRIILVPIIAIMMLVKPSTKPWMTVPTEIAEWAGYIFVLLGFMLRMWSILYIGQRKSKELIIEGPYSVCRDPLYLGTFFIVVGAGLCFENLAMALCGLMIYIPIHVLVARLEEKHLQEKFGDSYLEYLRTVPSFIPNLKLYKSPAEISVSVGAIRGATIEGSLIVLIPVIGGLIEFLHQNNLLPIYWRFP